MFASCERSWKMIRLSPHICWLTATLVTGSRKGRRKPSRRKAEREAIRLVISEPGGQHVRSKGHLLQICALPHSILERAPNPVVTLEAETSMGACCADVRLDGVCIFHCRPSPTPVEFDSARVAVRDKCRLQSAPRKTKKYAP